MYCTNETYVLSLENVKWGIRRILPIKLLNESHCGRGVCSASISLPLLQGSYNLSLYSQNVFGTSDVSSPFIIGIIVRYKASYFFFGKPGT